MGDDKTGETKIYQTLKTFEMDILVPTYGLLLCVKKTCDIKKRNFLTAFNPHILNVNFGKLDTKKKKMLNGKTKMKFPKSMLKIIIQCIKKKQKKTKQRTYTKE